MQESHGGPWEQGEQEVAEAPLGKQDAPELELELVAENRRVGALEGAQARVALVEGGGHCHHRLVVMGARAEQWEGQERCWNVKCSTAREETADFLAAT